MPHARIYSNRKKNSSLSSHICAMFARADTRASCVYVIDEPRKRKTIASAAICLREFLHSLGKDILYVYTVLVSVFDARSKQKETVIRTACIQCICIHINCILLAWLRSQEMRYVHAAAVAHATLASLGRLVVVVVLAMVAMVVSVIVVLCGAWMVVFCCFGGA